MALEIIGPGFGRTGTASLKQALEMLGFGPCHHMDEARAHPEQAPYWTALAEGRPVDWDALFAGYRSQIDWPGAHAWRALAAHFPAAKVLLSVRPEESWWRSYADTIGLAMSRTFPEDVPPYRLALRRAMQRLISEETFGGMPLDRDVVLAAYRRRIAEVRAEIPAGRLLVYDVTEGWAPLCRFLGVAVPDEPFPRVNSTDEFWAKLPGMRPTA
jgi:hypothetical protein